MRGFSFCSEIGVARPWLYSAPGFGLALVEAAVAGQNSTILKTDESQCTHRTSPFATRHFPCRRIRTTST